MPKDYPLDFDPDHDMINFHDPEFNEMMRALYGGISQAPDEKPEPKEDVANADYR